MTEILSGNKEIPIKINGKECVLKPMTTRHIIEMQNYLLKKKVERIKLLFADEKETRIKELKALYNEKPSIDEIMYSDIESLSYFLYIRCSIKDEIPFDDFTGSLEELEETISLAFREPEKNVERVKD